MTVQTKWQSSSVNSSRTLCKKKDCVKKNHSNAEKSTINDCFERWLPVTLWVGDPWHLSVASLAAHQRRWWVFDCFGTIACRDGGGLSVSEDPLWRCAAEMLGVDLHERHTNGLQLIQCASMLPRFIWAAYIRDSLTPSRVFFCKTQEGVRWMMDTNGGDPWWIVVWTMMVIVSSLFYADLSASGSKVV